MARYGTADRTAQCQNPGCRNTVPLCLCDIPKPMAVRLNPATETRFYGCQDYPKEVSCDHTVNIRGPVYQHAGPSVIL